MQVSRLMDAGYQLLTDQANGDVASIKLTKFLVGDFVGDYVDTQETTQLGNLVYEGGPGQISYTPMDSDNVLVRLTIPRTATTMFPGNVLLLANDNVPFIATITRSSITKLAQTEQSAGTKYILQWMITIPGLRDRLDFSTTVKETANFKVEFTDDDVTRWPWEEESDQVFVEHDKRVAGPALISQANRVYWATSRVYEYLPATAGGYFPVRED